MSDFASLLVLSTTTITKKCMTRHLISSNSMVRHFLISSDSQDLKADPQDEYLRTLRAIIRCFSCPDRYFEKVARQAIAGLGTDENSLTRVITTRAEVDLKLIKEAYQKRNSVPLERAVAGDTSGDYESMLLALLGQE